MDLPTSERLGLITVLRCFCRALRYCYFLLQSRCIPCLIASPLEMLCTLQYSCNFFSVSRSNLIVNFTSLGLSTLGLPVLGLNSSPHFLPCINFTKCQTKSQEFFRKKLKFHVYSSFTPFPISEPVFTAETAGWARDFPVRQGKFLQE